MIKQKKLWDNILTGIMALLCLLWIYPIVLILLNSLKKEGTFTTSTVFQLPTSVIAMRASIEQGTAPIALIGALAMKLRTMAKASAVRSGTISEAEAKTNSWVLKNATRQLSGWTSDGMRRCIQMLAWADEQSKTNGSDPVYALERSIELISSKGRTN